MRTFIAIDLPSHLRQSIAEVSQELEGRGVALVGEEVMHLSLHFLGDLSEKQIEEVREALGQIKPASFDVEVAGLWFFTPTFLKVVYAKLSKGEAQCTEIYNQLGNSLLEIGVIEEKEYRPHITLARVNRGADNRKILQVVEKYRSHFFGSFTVNSIKLKASELTEKGPIYTDLYEVQF
ncbi:MAG: RNA 2',3'-cyclic phosphodiesterase [Candidatus Micrarchaeota archaeon]|nr:RNA 2',3'-cyclic phosphodiesterase [Candidatus Micrarchaeota archaeon]MDE1847785.1 RNA 2',3'-cyclic phosphodiesterase [Candidatus Micrarchaeota archaeon]MDE1864223.1 RNA 2',3'-cyclic phosphodiesterase [Candidatus Micrarchaeota archaeon]